MIFTKFRAFGKDFGEGRGRKNHDLATNKSPSIFFKKYVFSLKTQLELLRTLLCTPITPWVPENGPCQVGTFFINLPRFGDLNERSSVGPTVPVRVVAACEDRYKLYE